MGKSKRRISILVMFCMALLVFVTISHPSDYQAATNWKTCSSKKVVSYDGYEIKVVSNFKYKNVKGLRYVSLTSTSYSITKTKKTSTTIKGKTLEYGCIGKNEKGKYISKNHGYKKLTNNSGKYTLNYTPISSGHCDFMYAAGSTLTVVFKKSNGKTVSKTLNASFPYQWEY